jgi:hypothetical protein
MISSAAVIWGLQWRLASASPPATPVIGTAGQECTFEASVPVCVTCQENSTWPTPAWPAMPWHALERGLDTVACGRVPRILMMI